MNSPTPLSLSLGLFAKTFSRPNLGELFSEIARHGLSSIQFNFSCCGLPTLPNSLPYEVLDQIRQEKDGQHLRFAAISATFNLIHPDPRIRQDGLERLPILAEAARSLDCPMLTLCTGTRDPDDLWRAHPGNASAEAWTDLRKGIESALELTEPTGIQLGIEPETANVIDSAKRCRQLLDEVGSPRLKVVLDPANLLHPGDQDCQRKILDEAFDLLGDSIGLAHAKELSPELVPDGRGPGRGILDWPHYLKGLYRTRFSGSLILHGLREEEVQPAVAYLSSLVDSSYRSHRFPVG